MLLFNGYIIICLSLAIIYIVGFFTFLTDYEENKCEMTYMFQFPQFVQIVTPFDYKFKKYGLYAYNEGHYTEKTRNMYFDGIPVLFIPGNAGSYKQVRSFASVALRKALDSKYGFHFDYFTLDLNGELSGINGILLNEQTDYANQSLHHILTLYKERKKTPSSVILIGHSMGGLIAQHISSLNEQLIPIIITLSSPLPRPSLVFDHYMHTYYRNTKTVSNHTIAVHLGGGFNDFLVPSYLSKGPGLNLLTTNIPTVWLSTDHLCILWCKQLVLAINRALFEAVDVKTKQISIDQMRLKTIFRKHLIKNSGTRTGYSEQRNEIMVDLNNAGEWIEKLARQYTVRLLDGTKEQQWHMIAYVNQPKHEYLSIVAINLELSDWIFACSASSIRGNSRVCTQAKHLSHVSEIAPSARYKRRNFNINMHALKQRFPNWTHIVAKVPPTREPVILHVDVYNKQERSVIVNFPIFWSTTKQNVIKETADKAIYYELRLPSLNHIIQSYLLYVEAFNCQNAVHHATASLTVPWGNENIHKHFTETDTKPLQLRLYSSKSLRSPYIGATIKLTLDPTCKYRISIQNHWIGSLGHLARYYSPLLLANVAAVIIMTLRSQFNAINARGKCPLFFAAMKEGAKPYYVITSAKLIAKFLGIKNFTSYIPITDLTILSDEGSDFFLLPLILYFVSVGIVWILAMVLAVLMIVWEASAHKLVTKAVAMSILGPVNISEWLLKGFQKLPGIVAGILIVISFTTCGGLALVIGAVFYFLKLTKMSQDFIEDLMWKVAKLFLTKMRNFFKRKNDTINADEKTDNNEKDNNLIASQNEHNQGIEGASTANPRIDKSAEEESSSDEDLGLLMKIKTEDETAIDKDNAINKKRELVKSEEVTQTNSNDTVAFSADSSPENTTGTLLNLLENDEIFFHFTVFLLWSVVASLNMPVVLAWAHNYKYKTMLIQDPSFLPGLTLSVCALALWQLEFPKIGRHGYKQLGNVLFVLTVLVLIYCTVTVYRLNYLLCSIIVIIVLHQLLAPNKNDNSSHRAGENDAINISSIFEKIKTKWE